MDKSPEAFRTISEVADALETPAHVLRFWESRFPQIRPVKRAGGRRYYRPADVALLGGIKHLLHDEGLTIRGVQKILREQGVRHVAAMAAGGVPQDFDVELEADEVAPDNMAPAEATSAQIYALETALRQPSSPPAASAEVVMLHAVTSDEDVAEEDVAEEDAGDGISMTALAVVAPDAAPAAPPEEVPEARHVWVDDEPELPLAGVAPFRQPQTPSSTPPASSPDPEPPTDWPAPKLSGIAARLQALPGPLDAGAVADLTELHSRLGLLHAQIAEAVRARR